MLIVKRVIFFFLLFFSTFLLSCSNQATNVPFDENESEFSLPYFQKLSFTPPEKINWEQAAAEKYEKPGSHIFRLENLPVKPLEITDFRPLKRPLTATRFNWNELPASPFDLTAVPAEKFRFKTSILGEPKRIKSNLPRLRDGATQNIFLFGQDQGLPGTVGQGSAMDDHGMIWLATDNGLCKYDGEFCTVYSIEQGLATNWYYQVLCDNKGKLWLTTNGNGIDILDLTLGVIKHLGSAEGLASDYIGNIMQDEEGFIWVATKGGLDIIDERAGKIRHLNDHTALNGNEISSVVEDDNRRIWISIAQKGMQVIDSRSNTIKSFNVSSGLPGDRTEILMKDKNGRIWFNVFARGLGIVDVKENLMYSLDTSYGLKDGRVTAIAEDHNGNIWIGTDGGGVDIFDPALKQVKNFSSRQGLSNNNVYSLLLDNAGQVWIGTNGGEYNIYNTSDISLQHFTSAQGFSNKTSFFYAMAEDDSGFIWIGSLGGGVDIMDEKNHLIRHLDTLNGLSDNRIASIFKDHAGNMWISGGNGVDLIDMKEGKIRHILPKIYASAIIEDKKQQIWIGGSTSLYMISNDHTVISRAGKETGWKGSFIFAMASDKNQNIIISSTNGLFIINEGMAKQVLVDKYLTNSSGWSLLADHAGNIWVATDGGGLYRLDSALCVSTRFSIKEGLADNFILSLLEKNGRIYAGTGKGLTIINAASSPGGSKINWSFKSYAKSQGFLRVDFNPPSLVARSGRIWWTTADVLTAMDETQHPAPGASFSVYLSGIDIMESPQNFLGENERRKMFLSTDTLWAADGSRYYLKDSLPVDSAYHIKHHIQWDATLGPTRMPVNLRLPYDQNHITIHFTAARLANVDKTRYRYFLQGNDIAWSPITANSYADYRNLNPGAYIFKVRSRDFNGRWSKETSFRFTITPPWWRMWWAYLLYAVLFIAAVRAYIVYRSQKLRRENKILEENISQRTAQLQKSLEDLKATQSQLIHSEKMASLGELTAGIAHEIQNPLNFINNFSEVNDELIEEMKNELKNGNEKGAFSLAEDIRENHKKIIHHGRRADSIVKGMLLHSRISPGQKELTDINALADEYLRLSYHGLRAKDKSFNADFQADLDESLEKISVVRQDIGRALLNIYNNAFYAVSEKKKELSAVSKAGEDYRPLVTVSTKKQKLPPEDGAEEKNYAEIIIKDNGNGIPARVVDKIFQPFFTTKPATQGTGLGLSLAYDIVKVHGGEIKVETKEGEGTRFIIFLPTA